MKKTGKVKFGRKTYIIIAVVIMVIFAAAAILLIEFPEVFLPKENINTMYSPKNYDVKLYEPDYDYDIFSDEEYLLLDRNIYYKRGGEESIISGGGDDSKAALFFVKYFEAAVNGRAEEYNSFFTEAYYKDNKPYEKFTKQMIYDIHIEELSETSGGFTLNVSYRIFKNNGTFRNDIGPGASKTLYFELTEVNGELKINKIDAYVYF